MASGGEALPGCCRLASDWVPCQINLFEPAVDRGPPRAQRMRGPKPLREHEHEGQQQTEQERDPSFHGVVLS